MPRAFAESTADSTYHQPCHAKLGWGEVCGRDSSRKGWHALTLVPLRWGTRSFGRRLGG